jgi:hypothetical protein
LNWKNSVAPAPSSSKSLQIARRRAEALNQLYQTNRAHEGHTVWIIQNQILFLPLIKAMARVSDQKEILLVGVTDGPLSSTFSFLETSSRRSRQDCRGAAEQERRRQRYGNALQAASVEGHDKIVEVLLSKGGSRERLLKFITPHDLPPLSISIYTSIKCGYIEISSALIYNLLLKTCLKLTLL